MDPQGGAGGSNNSSDFVRKLYKMLENPQDESVVRWGNEGDSFVVLENEKFTKHILPKHFKHSNFASFVRQLNKYDFHKVRHNNEENGQSPYGAGAWEFKHPDFKANNKDALDNIRRKAPAPRKPNATADDLMIPTQQMDMINSQLVATQQQLQQLQERYNELSLHHSMMVQEVIGMQKNVVNHEQVMLQMMNFLQTVDAQRRRDSRIHSPFAQANNAPNGVDQSQAGSVDEEPPASPLQHAQKLLSETNVNGMLNPQNLEQLNEMTLRMNGTLTTPPPDYIRGVNRPASRGGAPASSNSSHSYRFGDYEPLVYPVGQTQGIDPMYSEHIHNIPYGLPSKTTEAQVPASNAPANTVTAAATNQARKKSSQIDPGWVRAPQILLVEDDPTCRRIGGKFLFAFHCQVDTALDGLEAVQKINAGSKYDLILMDIIMPNLDGVSACHLIRQVDATPIIAMTSNIRSDDITMYFQHGMNDVLPKPFTKDGLLQMLEKHLAHLKKTIPQAIESMVPPQVAPLMHTSTRVSLKDEDSPAKSPATSNWNSPSQITGVSPVGSSIPDEYMGGIQQVPTVGGVPSGGLQPMQGHPSTFAVAHSMGPGGLAYNTSPQMPRGPGHRRQISDITGGDEMTNNAKRQMYAQVQQPQTIPQMQRPR